MPSDQSAAYILGLFQKKKNSIFCLFWGNEEGNTKRKQKVQQILVHLFGGHFLLYNLAKHEIFRDAAVLLTVGRFLLTVELFYLQLTILAFTYSWSFLAYSFSFSACSSRAFLHRVGKCV